MLGPDFPVAVIKIGTCSDLPWNITGNSFATTLTLENGGVVKGGKEVGKLHVDNFAVKGAGNVFTLDATTNLNGTITFADKDSELITNLDTAYAEVKFSEQEANGAKVSVLDGAKGKLKVEAKEGGTLSVMDSFTYSSAGLSSLAEAYKGLTLKLDNASLYVAPKKPDESIWTIGAKTPWMRDALQAAPAAAGFPAA